MSQPSIYCVITADYEVFLGRNFLSYDEVLFKPSQQMMSVCEARSAPITFFADVCSVWAHRSHENLGDYVNSFESQLKLAVRNGHDVQLHLHPHWLKSTYTNGEWRISSDQMYLHELGFHEGQNSAGAVIDAGVRYLDDLLRPVKPDYRCHAFRAAGLALQPDGDKLVATLLRHGITVDASVAKNLRLRMDTVNIDYSGMPEYANWFMNSSGGIRKPADDGLLEVPIATFQSGLATRLGFLIRRAMSVTMRRGSSISRTEKQTRLANLMSLLHYNWRYVCTNAWFLFSCDTKGLTLKMLMDGIDNYISRHGSQNTICLSMINHPKMMFQPQFDLLGNLIDRMRDKYKDRVKFVTFADTLQHCQRKAG
ncbi:MAG: hypothetical protein JSV52_13340 [Candidatus Zixiibacteriota bacterium]|nr:MAG: hypothetical protein JSV52_13340 [candidate division Zixibacteria bacterium]